MALAAGHCVMWPFGHLAALYKATGMCVEQGFRLALTGPDVSEATQNLLATSTNDHSARVRSPHEQVWHGPLSTF